VISGFLSKFDILPYIFDKTTILISLATLVALIFLRYKNSRLETIKVIFTAEEFKQKKKTLNIIFVFYLVFTVLAMFLGPFYKPDYLPKMWE